MVARLKAWVMPDLGVESKKKKNKKREKKERRYNFYKKKKNKFIKIKHELFH